MYMKVVISKPYLRGGVLTQTPTELRRVLQTTSNSGFWQGWYDIKRCFWPKNVSLPVVRCGWPQSRGLRFPHCNSLYKMHRKSTKIHGFWGRPQLWDHLQWTTGNEKFFGQKHLLISYQPCQNPEFEVVWSTLRSSEGVWVHTPPPQIWISITTFIFRFKSTK